MITYSLADVGSFNEDLSINRTGGYNHEDVNLLSVTSIERFLDDIAIGWNNPILGFRLIQINTNKIFQMFLIGYWF